MDTLHLQQKGSSRFSIWRRAQKSKVFSGTQSLYHQFTILTMLNWDNFSWRSWDWTNTPTKPVTRCSTWTYSRKRIWQSMRCIWKSTISMWRICSITIAPKSSSIYSGRSRKFLIIFNPAVWTSLIPITYVICHFLPYVKGKIVKSFDVTHI